MKALERRQRILETLCERRYEKVENLAFEFSVNESTVRRDIQELSLSYPIYTKTGVYGGVYVAEGSYLGRQYLKREQKEFLEKIAGGLAGMEREQMQTIIRQFARPDCGN